MARSRAETRHDAAYMQLAQKLRNAILRHDYPDGVQLPTEAELAERHRVSRQTVRRAFQDLVAEGMVYRVPGRGTFAAPRNGQYLRQFGSIDDLMGLSIDTTMQLVSPLQRQINLDAAGRLRLTTDSVFTLAFLRLHDDTPFCHTAVYLPPAVGELIADKTELTRPGQRSESTIIGLLDAKLPAPIIEAEQSITVGYPTSGIAEQLHCESRHALLRIDRLYLTSDAQPVELAISHFVPEHYSYRVHLRRNQA